MLWTQFEIPSPAQWPVCWGLTHLLLEFTQESPFWPILLWWAFIYPQQNEGQKHRLWRSLGLPFPTYLISDKFWQFLGLCFLFCKARIIILPLWGCLMLKEDNTYIITPEQCLTHSKGFEAWHFSFIITIVYPNHANISWIAVCYPSAVPHQGRRKSCDHMPLGSPAISFLLWTRSSGLWPVPLVLWWLFWKWRVCQALGVHPPWIAGASIVPNSVWLAFWWSFRDKGRKEKAWLKTTHGSPGMIKVTGLPVSWAELTALELTWPVETGLSQPSERSPNWKSRHHRREKNPEFSRKI